MIDTPIGSERRDVVCSWFHKALKSLGDRAYLPVWLAIAGVGIALALADEQNKTIQLQHLRASVQNEASLIRSRLEGHLNADIQLVNGLVAVLSTNPDLDQLRFSEIAARAVGSKKEFINIAVAPNLVVKMVHPYEANKSVIGLDYTENDAQRAAALRVRDSGEMVLAGPVNLIQGGLGFIGRFPIFIDKNEEEMFWGIASVVLDVAAIYAQTGLTDPASHIEIALVGRDGMGPAGELFFGKASTLEADPVLMDIVLPVGSWQLAAIPKGGWAAQSEELWRLRLILLGAGLLILIPTFLACHLSAIRQGVIRVLSHREHELKSKQAELKRLSTVAQNASDSIVLTSPDTRIIWVNDAFTRMTGYSAQEALGHTPGELLNGPETDPDVIKTIINHKSRGESLRTEILNYTKSGEKIWVDTRTVPVLDDDGRVTMVIGIERDVTQAKLHEMELAEAKRVAEQSERVKSEFLANMSHEIRTPMNGIMGMADLLSESALCDEDQQCVDTIRSSSEALLKIINDILDLSRLEAGKLSMSEVDFDLRPCIDGVVEVLRPTASVKGFPINVVYGADLPTSVCADDGRLRQILLNLTGNAVKFTAKGHVCLHVNRSDDDPNRLLITVEDTGIGLDEDEIKQVFDRFSQADAAITRAYGGTGLGLTISRRLAEQMGGGISLKSEKGVGSHFTVEIQTKPSEGPIGKHVLERQFDLSALRGRRVLIAEDNRTNRLLLRKYLADLAIELIEAEDGQLATSLCAETHPDIILMDMSMPKMDGISATKAIRNMPIPQPLIIALTANAFQSDQDACLKAGMDAFLSKPIKKMDLLQEMATTLTSHSKCT